MSILQRLADRRDGSGGPEGGPLPPAESRWPALSEMVLTTTGPDGKPREPSRITLMLDRGTFKAAITESMLKASCFVSGRSLEHVLDILEATVQEDHPDIWKPWPDGQKPWTRGRK